MPDTQVAGHDVPGLGHNQPPDDVLDANWLKERLTADYAELATRVIELEAATERVAPTVNDEGTAQKLTDFVGKQLRPLITDLVGAHGTEKRPYFKAGQVCDDFFLRRRDRVEACIKTIERRVQKFHEAFREAQRKREAEERRRAEEQQRAAEAEQRRLQAEADQRAAQGDRQGSARVAAEAEAAGERAEHAAAIVTAPAEPVRIHGDYGSTAFVRSRLDYEVLDPLLIPLGYLTIDDKAVRAAMAEGVREIPGLRIFETEKLTIRGS
jgi:hypothetical protein